MKNTWRKYGIQDYDLTNIWNEDIKREMEQKNKIWKEDTR